LTINLSIPFSNKTGLKMINLTIGDNVDFEWGKS
jgi:hypothetical protein